MQVKNAGIMGVVVGDEEAEDMEVGEDKLGSLESLWR